MSHDVGEVFPGWIVVLGVGSDGVVWCSGVGHGMGLVVEWVGNECGDIKLGGGAMTGWIVEGDMCGCSDVLWMGTVLWELGCRCVL